MRLRPATPLSILLLAAFTLLLLSVLSTPVITSIHLAVYKNVTFGVFGFCNGDKCSGVSMGYNMDVGSSPPGKSDFSLPSNARNSLSNLLIVHPIAAFFTLVLLALSVGAHLHGPAHSPRYLLVLLILSLPTFLLSLLAFLVDVLIFLPHMQWGAWVVLGATIMIAVAGVVVCGIRRTVVSREARKRRIDGNAAMNGSDLYASQAAARQQAAAPVDKLPEFTTFEVDKPTRGEPEGERIPLNPRARTVSPSLPDSGSRAGSFTRASTLTRESSDRSVGYGPASRGTGPLSRPMLPGQVRSQYSNGSLAGSSSATGPYGMPPQQRGGYDRGYGGDRFDQGSPGGFRGPTPPVMYPPPGGLAPPPRRGPSPGQLGPRVPSGGGYGGGAHGYGMGPPLNNGMMGAPPNNGIMRGLSPHGIMGGSPAPMVMGGGRPMPPPGSRRHSYSNPSEEVHDERDEFERTLPPVVAIGLAKSGDEREYYGPAELSDESVGEAHAGRLSVVNEGWGTPNEEYIPPRQAWQRTSTGTPSPAQPVELPAGPESSQTTPPAQQPQQPQQPQQSQQPQQQPQFRANSYYEDVSPAFDHSHHPLSLTPGYQSHSHDEPSMSPTMSISSHFTSVSQRPQNPMVRPDDAGR